MDDVRIGLVGCGLFGESHLCAFRAIPGVRVAAVYDPNRERATNRAREFGVPLVCGSLEELCAVPVDAIDVVSPEDRHLEPVLAALRAGHHVFVEKPLAMDLEHCEYMIRTAREAGVFLMPGHLLRFETRFGMLKEEIGRGGLGRIVSIVGSQNQI
jgi:predicted dehydrogenase